MERMRAIDVIVELNGNGVYHLESVTTMRSDLWDIFDNLGLYGLKLRCSIVSLLWRGYVQPDCDMLEPTQSIYIIPGLLPGYLICAI